MALGTLLDVHGSFAWVVVIGNGLAGVWALAAERLHALRTRALWWFTGAVQVAIFVQVILGIAVQEADDIEAPEFHMFYGFVALFTVGIVYAYKSQVEEHRHVLYGLGGLFLMGLGIRAMVLR